MHLNGTMDQVKSNAHKQIHTKQRYTKNDMRSIKLMERLDNISLYGVGNNFFCLFVALKPRNKKRRERSVCLVCLLFLSFHILIVVVVALRYYESSLICEIWHSFTVGRTFLLLHHHHIAVHWTYEKNPKYKAATTTTTTNTRKPQTI